MRLAALIISLCLHFGLFLLIWFWPASAPPRISAQPMMISLVEGAPGGDRLPSPILGHVGEPSEGPVAPAPPAPRAEVAAPAREEIRAPEALIPAQAETPAPVKPEPAPIPEKAPEPIRVPEPPKPAPPKPEPPKPEAKPEPKKPEPPKPEPKKPEPKKPEPKKPEPKKPAPKKPAPKKVDPVAAALAQARRKATSRAESGDSGNAIERALAQARRGAGGTSGGGGGEGEGPGGGGLGDVYVGQVMLAVRPNWGFASPGRRALACVVKVIVDMRGNVEQAVITQGSGNAQFDASAVNSIIRTSQAGDFPPPPGPEYTDLDLVFTLDEMMGR